MNRTATHVDPAMGSNSGPGFDSRHLHEGRLGVWGQPSKIRADNKLWRPSLSSPQAGTAAGLVYAAEDSTTSEIRRGGRTLADATALKH